MKEPKIIFFLKNFNGDHFNILGKENHYIPSNIRPINSSRGRLSIEAHTCNPRALEAETGGLPQVEDNSGLHIKSISLGYYSKTVSKNKADTEGGTG